MKEHIGRGMEGAKKELKIGRDEENLWGERKSRHLE